MCQRGFGIEAQSTKKCNWSKIFKLILSCVLYIKYVLIGCIAQDLIFQ